MLHIGADNNQSKIAFKALKIKNPERMTSEVLKSLDNVKDLFDRFPNASVELKTKNKIGVFLEDTGWETLFGIGNKVSQVLHFNLGKSKDNKSIGKFTISGHKNTYDWAASFFENVTDAFRACKSNSYAKIAALKHLNRQIDRNGVQARIEQAIKHN
ncbi:hypothetical protein IJO12_08185 [bacterium]|nr:hypothetical protein [bacterium]